MVAMAAAEVLRLGNYHHAASPGHAEGAAKERGVCGERVGSITGAAGQAAVTQMMQQDKAMPPALFQSTRTINAAEAETLRAKQLL